MSVPLRCPHHGVVCLAVRTDGRVCHRPAHLGDHFDWSAGPGGVFWNDDTSADRARFVNTDERPPEMCFARIDRCVTVREDNARRVVAFGASTPITVGHVGDPLPEGWPKADAVVHGTTRAVR